MENVLKISREYNTGIKVDLDNLKLGECKLKLNNFRNMGTKNIYDVLNSSLSEYESRKINNELQGMDVDSKSNSIGLERDIKRRNSLIEDSTYPLYKGFYCHRGSYTGSRSTVKHVVLHEFNVTRNFIQTVYYYNKSKVPYREDRMNKTFSKIEIDVIIPELLTSLFLDVISEKELNTLIDILSKDEIMRKEILNISKMVRCGYGIRMVPVTEHCNEYRFTKPSVKDILKTQVELYLTTILHQVLQACRKRIGINIKSVTDFRIIFELDDVYDRAEVELITKNENGDRASITARSYSINEQIKELKSKHQD